MSDTMNKNIAQWYEEHSKEAMDLMHQIWLHPETGLQEHFASRATADFIRKNGFENVELHAAEDYDNPEKEPNAVVAVWGSGKPVIGIIGELDALPGLGQDAVPYKSLKEGPGHGCGHNLMAGGSAAAACALRYAMEKEGLTGTLKFVEAPAEELGCGKGYLAMAGVFDDMDIALMWHAGYTDLTFTPRASLAVFDAEFEFHGKSSHAAGGPWNGRSALDAVQLMNIGCEFLREHTTRDTFIHYCITNGGSAANIVPDYASVHYMFRAGSNEGAKDLFERGIRVARGAALMTDTTMEYKVTSAIPHMYTNIPLCKYMYEAALKLPKMTYTEEEYKYARELYKNLFDKEAPAEDDLVISTKIQPFSPEEYSRPITTDAADVSFICPTVHFTGWGMLINAPGHHWSTTSTTGCGLGEKAGLYGYMVAAQGGYDALTNPKIIEECKEYHKSQNIPDYREWRKSIMG